MSPRGPEARSALRRSASRIAGALRYGVRCGFPAWHLWHNRRARAHRHAHPPEVAPGPPGLAGELRERGACSRAIADVAPGEAYGAVRLAAEAASESPSGREAIQRAARALAAPASPGGSPPYRVSLWGHLDDVGRSRFVHLAVCPEILEIASAYMGLSCSLAHCDAWYNLPSPGDEVPFQRWHRDGGDRVLLKLYVYLREVGPATGPLEYVAGTHSLGADGGAFPIWWGDVSKAVESRFGHERRRLFTGPAGTAVFADTAGLHRGGHVRSGARLIFYALYTSDVGRPAGLAARYDRHIDPGARLSPAQRYALGLAGGA